MSTSSPTLKSMSTHVIEIKKHFGYSAHSTVIQHLKALEKKGYIKVAYKQKEVFIY